MKTPFALRAALALGHYSLPHAVVFHSQRGPMDVLNGDRLTVPAGTICKVEQTEPDCVLLSFTHRDHPSARWFAWLHAGFMKTETMKTETDEPQWSVAEMDNEKVEPTVRIFKRRKVRVGENHLSNKICIGRLDSLADAKALTDAANVLPELLRALTACITPIPDRDITRHRARIAEINGIARTAIAKATGQTK